MWDVYAVLFGLLFTGFALGLVAERMLLSPMAWIRFQNIVLKKNRGVAYLFFRSKYHQSQVIDLNQPAFEFKGVPKQFHIVSEKAERVGAVPHLYYVEDSSEPISPSTIGKVQGGISPEDLHTYILQTTMFLKAKEAENQQKFQKLLLWLVGGVAVGILILFVFVLGIDGKVGNVGNICYSGLEATQNVSRYITGV